MKGWRQRTSSFKLTLNPFGHPSLILLDPTSAEPFSQCDQLSWTPTVQTFLRQQRLHRGESVTFGSLPGVRKCREPPWDFTGHPLWCSRHLQRAVDNATITHQLESHQQCHTCAEGARDVALGCFFCIHSHQVQLRVQNTHSRHLSVLLLILLGFVGT